MVMKYEEPNMQILMLEIDDVVRTSDGVQDGTGTIYPGDGNKFQ